MMTKKRALNITTFLVVLLFLNLPLVSALEISNIHADGITDNSAVIKWTTDDVADSFVSYGLTQQNLNKVGDARLTTAHQLTLTNLNPENTYYYSVESNGVIDNENGNFYSFTTPAPDTSAPDLVIELPDRVAGNQINLVGYTEPGARVNLFINDALMRNTVAELLEVQPATEEPAEEPTEEPTEETTEEAAPEEDAEEPVTEPLDESVEQPEEDSGPPSDSENEEQVANETIESESDAIIGAAFTSPETTTRPEGRFTFPNVILRSNVNNIITIEVIDSSGNDASVTKNVFADTDRPNINLGIVPTATSENQIRINATISENSSIEIFVNNNSVLQSVGTTINQEIRLQEGDNNIRIIAKDNAGWETVEEFTVLSDTQPPRVDFTLTKGQEYYEGRAQTSIVGETEAGAKVYLYIYRSRADDFRADFKHAIKTTTADPEGNFEFKEVKFPPPILSSLEELMPREVPSGLEDILIPHLDNLEEEQRKTYYLYIIAEDQTGKTGFDRDTVHVNTCYSGNFAFDIFPNAEFPPQPFRLNPQLIEDGRETIGAVFDVTYRGSATGFTTPDGDVEEAYRIVDTRFDKACTREMANNDEYKLGCQLLGSLTPHSNADDTLYYVTGNLQSSDEFLESDFSWKDFQKRQIKLPLKILVRYQERESDGDMGDTKTQVFCYDLGYFVDIPIESSDMVPDFLANEGVSALNATIHAIEKIKPILDTAMKITGVSCFFSYGTKFMAMFYRKFRSNFEHLTSAANPEKDCPSPVDQQLMFNQKTIDKWSEMSNHPDANFPPPEKMEALSLKKECPSTAGAWNFESTLDQLYRFTCDRFFCRKVPAKWTSRAEDNDIRDVYLSQTQCAATSTGVPLTIIENCQEKLERNAVSTEILRSIEQEVFTCYENRDGVYYYPDPDLNTESTNIWQLRPVGHVFAIGVLPSDNLLAYQEPGSQSFMVAVDQKCNTVCRRTPGYVATTTGFLNDGACYREEYQGSQTSLRGQGDARVVDGRLMAGYTRDCFINQKEDLYQCVCERETESSSTRFGVREALVEKEGIAEPWIYRQDALYEESRGTRGTHYSDDRYYKGRDFSGAFGLNAGLDNLKTDISNMKNTHVDPFNQYFGAWQSLCLPVINAQLNLLQSVLKGMRDCIIEAKHSSFQDAGMCKTLFTQHVCGLVYKGISSLFKDCSPVTARDREGGDNPTTTTAKATWDSFRAAIPSTIQSSSNQLRSDYGASAENYFSSGASGMAQSLCLLAIGYDVPLIDMDFITDAAYSVPMKTSVYFPIANRELTTFDPSQGTATYSYGLGGTILPGCNIRGYRSYLKCIGPEDRGNPGVSCEEQNCDCINIDSDSAQLYEDERKYPIPEGSGFGGITKLDVFDFPIESPLRVSSAYRYDHVVVELTLDHNEDPEKCFDNGYQTPNGGKFYFPIHHIQSDNFIECIVDPDSGRYSCPALSSLFGSGQSYLETPFFRCQNPRTEEWGSCETPNTFLSGDEITVRPHLNLGQEPACLRITERSDLVRRVDLELPGDSRPYNPPFPLGVVDANMLGGGRLATLSASSDAGRCGINVLNHPDSDDVNSGSIVFRYSSPNIGFYNLQLPNGVTIADANYDLTNNNYLTKDGTNELSLDDINNAEFTYQNFRFNLELNGLSSGDGDCSYTVRRGSQGQASGTKTLRINLELLKLPPGGTCFTATEQLPSTSLGKVVHSQVILIQDEPVEVELASEMHEQFMDRDYASVKVMTNSIIQRSDASLAEAIAIYYYVASAIMLNDDPSQIRSMLGLFFERTFGRNTVAEFPSEVTSFGEYQKIVRYLCVVDSRFGGTYQDHCDDISTGNVDSSPATSTSSSATLCGQDLGLNKDFVIPSNWQSYSCQDSNSKNNCYGYSEYVPDGLDWRTYGCPGTQECCADNSK